MFDYLDGSLVEIAPEGVNYAVFRRRPRGRTGQWGRPNGARLARSLGAVAWQYLGPDNALVFHLTQPGEYVPVDELGAAWSRLRLRLRRVKEGHAGYRVVEFQKRGAAHIHGLLLGVDVDDDDALDRWRQWFDRSWAECLRVGRADTTVDRVDGPTRVMNYLTGYLEKGGQKVCPDDQHVGQWWATFGAMELYRSQVVDRWMTAEQAARFFRIRDALMYSRARVAALRSGEFEIISRVRERRCDRLLHAVWCRMNPWTKQRVWDLLEVV